MDFEAESLHAHVCILDDRFDRVQAFLEEVRTQILELSSGNVDRKVDAIEKALNFNLPHPIITNSPTSCISASRSA